MCERSQSQTHFHRQLRSPALPVPAKKTQHVPLAHSVFASELQDSTGNTFGTKSVLGRFGTCKLKADAVGQFLLVEIRRVGRFEFGEVEFLARAGLGVVVLGSWG